MIVLLIIVAFIVGTLIGSVGIGGILLIPALALFANLSTQVSMATALFSFIFTGVVGTYMFQRRGSIDWHITIPVCLGAICFGYLGAAVNSMVNATLLNIILSLIIIFAGVYASCSGKGNPSYNLSGRPRLHKIGLFGIGAAVGFGSGLTGVGGPVLSVPMMVIMGFAPLTAIAASQVIQIVAAISGTLGNLKYGSINFSVGVWITLIELAGVLVGVRIAHSAETQQLRKFVVMVCILVGGTIFIRSSGIAGFVWSYVKALP